MLNLDRSAWTRARFGDVVRNVNETVRDADAAGIDRVIAMEHLDPGELVVARWGDIAEGTTFTRRVRPGQTLFGKRRAYQRKAARADFDAICSGDILVFEANPERLLPDFLPFLVQSEGFYAHALGTSAGSLSPRTNWRDLSAYEFDLPPLDRQRSVADLLWALEGHRTRLAVLAVRADADEGSEGSPRRALFGKRFGSTTEVTKEPFARLVAVSSGRFLPASAMASGGTIPVFGGNGVSGFHDEAMFEMPVVVVGRVGAYCGCVHFTDQRSWVTDNALVAEPLLPGYSRDFLAAALRFARLGDYASKTAQPLVSAGRLARVTLPVPDSTQQGAYLRDSHRLGEVVGSVGSELKSLSELRASIHQALGWGG